MKYSVLTNPRAKSLSVLTEDFDQIASYFRDIIRDRSWSALPGGVIDTFVPSSGDYARISLEADDFRGYRLDSEDYLAAEKAVIARALEVIEGRPLQDADFTLCPSVSMGSLFTLLAMKRKNVRTMVAELPAYFGSVEQAMVLDINTLLWPTLPNEAYSMTLGDVRYIRESLEGPILLLMTQPRYAMGHLRSAEFFARIRDQLREGDVLAIDEAADQSTPALLGQIDHDGPVQVIRLRGLTKGLGLNSARVAAIFHPHDWRSELGEIVDYAGGNLDSASLKVVTTLCANPQKYVDLLQAAKRYVHDQRRKLESLLRGLPIFLSALESGYIGTAHVPFANSGAGFSEQRLRFLEICKDERMPVVLGSSMYFPYDFRGEIFRINYFTPNENIEHSAVSISKVLKRFSVPKLG